MVEIQNMVVIITVAFRSSFSVFFVVVDSFKVSRLFIDRLFKVDF